MVLSVVCLGVGCGSVVLRVLAGFRWFVRLVGVVGASGSQESFLGSTLGPRVS